MWLFIQILISIKLCYQNVSKARMQATGLKIISIIIIPRKFLMNIILCSLIKINSALVYIV